MAKKKTTAAEAASDSSEPTEKTFRQSVAEAAAGMIYISESEAPLELEDWPDVTDLATLQAKITAGFSIPPEAQATVTPDDFLAAIRQMADPADPVMVDYASRYGKLFMLLKADASGVTVIRASGEQLHIFIAAFGAKGTVIIHTTATET